MPSRSSSSSSSRPTSWPSCAFPSLFLFFVPRVYTVHALSRPDPDFSPLFLLPVGVLDVQAGFREATTPEEDTVTAPIYAIGDPSLASLSVPFSCEPVPSRTFRPSIIQRYPYSLSICFIYTYCILGIV
ncbi:hypothetical protein ZEAMMB73_Zm00001d050534 [Zea mays]|uniref:Uncharacterized protein n=1 Tax=Zea mays TaxID=4577 RepID=A0A1D6Q253_MAIZE|nr:hypothetical protein ZEAMMB73_Zm00001d050534 [Zea mays]